MGRMHAHAYRALNFYYDPAPARIVLAGVATRTEASWKRAVEEWGFESGTTDFRELCERDDIDIVDCATPNDSHREVLLAALGSGKHLYMDKPLATCGEDALEMARCASLHPRCITQMAFQYRFVPALLRARQLIEEGALGRLFTARVAYLHAGYIDPGRPFSWRLDVQKSGPGGALFDLGSHVVDLTRWLLGDFREVLHLGETFIRERPLKEDPSQKIPVKVDDVSILLFRMENGCIGTLESSRMATGSQDEVRFEAHGDRGALRFNLMQPNFLEYYDATAAGGPYGGDRGAKRIECVGRYPPPASLPGPKNTIGWERFHVHSIWNFISHVVEGSPSQPDILEGARTQAVLEAALRSGSTGRWEKVPPVDVSGARGKEPSHE